MKSSIQILRFCLFILLIISVSACGDKKTKDSDSPNQGRELDFTDQVVFLDEENNEIANIKVAVADDQQERNQGLMDVNNLPSDAGMIFLFPDEKERSFYMANTPLPLDILFINSDSTIVRIHHNTSPFSSKQLSSGSPAQYVVETNAGYCIAHDIQEGMKIRF